MDRDPNASAPIDRRFEGEPVHVGARTVQPVGRMTGRRIRAGGAQGEFSGVMAKLQPVEIVVREGDEMHTIFVEDPQPVALRGIFMAGLAVCVACILTMGVARALARRRSAA